jgi:hypothetical protein
MVVGVSPSVARADSPNWSVTFDSGAGQYWLNAIGNEGLGDLTDIQVASGDLQIAYHGTFDCFIPDYWVDGSCPLFLYGSGYLTIYTDNADPEDVFVPEGIE